MRKILDRFYLGCFYLAILCLCLICLVVAGQVFCNLVNKGAGIIAGKSLGWQIPSYSDFTGYFLVGTTFLAAAYTFRQGSHIRVKLFLDRTGGRLRKALEILSCAVVVGVMGMATWYSLQLCLESLEFGDLSPGLIPIPIWIPQAVMVAGCFVLWVAVVDTFIQLVRGQSVPYMTQDAGTDQ